MLNFVIVVESSSTDKRNCEKCRKYIFNTFKQAYLFLVTDLYLNLHINYTSNRILYIRKFWGFPDLRKE